MNADILEIFSSIQGEGPFMGIRQIFVKFAPCNLKCRFCDLESAFGPKRFSIDKLMSIIKQISENSGDHHSVSLTGGEPLLFKDFLKTLLPKIGEMNLKRYLETNATLPDALAEVIDDVDIVAADFKLPSSTGGDLFWKEHKEFLRIARKKNCFVKIVITEDTKKEDVKKAIDIIEEIDKEILLILQPVWPMKGVKPVKNRTLFNYLFLAEERLANTRIMPQMHKVLGVK